MERRFLNKLMDVKKILQKFHQQTVRKKLLIARKPIKSYSIPLKLLQKKIENINLISKKNELIEIFHSAAKPRNFNVRSKLKVIHGFFSCHLNFISRKRSADSS